MTVGSSPQPGWGPLSPVAFPFNLHSIFSSVNIKPFDYLSITHHRKPSPETEHPRVKSKPHSWPRRSEKRIFHPCAKAPSVVCPVSTAGDLMDA